MTPLQCRAVGQTPIYDQLRAERINANISLRDVDPYRLVSSGRHCLDADAPCAAAMLVHPQGPELPKMRGHHRWGTGLSAVGVTGAELGSRGKRLLVRRLVCDQRPNMAALSATTARSYCTRLGGGRRGSVSTSREGAGNH
jgi:hypothetical protein